jgi:menaquinone-dependent protoporphyrinogen oxidase
MRFLIVYASTEGQTEKIAHVLSERLREQGHAAACYPVAEAPEATADAFDAAILAGSVHVGSVQPALVAYGRDNASALRAMPVLYLQVSLSAAGADSDEKETLERITRSVVQKMGWAPDRVAQVAGALRFGQYGFFKRMMMRQIAAEKDPTLGPGMDNEYTDWHHLAGTLDAWTRSIGADGTG